ncbi:hypothetical protein HYU92_06460 [Candidatus Curtissbacteria bacterium]|nr:hypothetical protein [Candidatus Curtissbacteria bacterium]
MSDTRFWHKTIIVLSLLFFAQILGPFVKEGLFLGHDSQLHLIYLKKVEEAIRAGQFPVRWIDWFVPAHNQPLFNFYQPGIHYLFVIPRFLGVPNTTALEATVVIVWYLSALLMFLFARRHFGTLGGILAAYFYLIAPYHILDIFIRAALPEFTALAFTPGIFWGIKAYFDTGRGIYLTATAFFVGATTLSHPPTIIMFSPIIAAYLGYLTYLKKSLNFLFSILISLLVGFGLISFFIIPAFFEQKYVQTIFMRSGYYDFHHHFVCFTQLFKPYWAHGTSQTGCEDKISFQLGIVHWLVIGLIIFVITSKFFAKKQTLQFIDLSLISQNQYRLLILFMALIVLFIYMTLPPSLTIWENMPYIPYIQYPWRFLAPITFLSSFIAGAILLIFKKETAKLAAFAILILASSLAYASYLKPVAYATNEAEINFGNEILHESVTGIKELYPEPGYMPRWTQILPADSDRPKSEVKVATDSAKVASYRLAAHRKEYQIEVREPTVGRFYTHYFPGWKIFVNDREVQPNYDNIYGFMDIPLPTGNHQIKLLLENTPIRTFANMLSVNFAIVAVALAFLFDRANRKTNG